MPLIRSLELFHIALPLKRKIKHASHERSTSDSLVARILLDDGSVGYGEGVPRSYVTGETIETAFDALSRIDAAKVIGKVDRIEALIDTLCHWQLPEIAADPRGMFGNAARCAFELALFDAFGRSFDLSLTAILRKIPDTTGLLFDRPHPVRYSGAITAESVKKERISAWKMRIYGFHQVKVKVGVDGQDDATRLRNLRMILGPKVDLRIDANEAWSAAELLDKVKPLRGFGVTALEQPLPHAQVAELTKLRPEVGIPIMLDESLCGLPDAVAAIEQKTADILNVRLSKCGGLINSLRIVGLAKQAGLGFQLGCHPGETGLLSAAGRHFASNVAGIRYVEGSYDRHVLERNLTLPDITFRYGGRAKPLNGPGLGVEVNRDALAAMTIHRKEV